MIMRERKKRKYSAWTRPADDTTYVWTVYSCRNKKEYMDYMKSHNRVVKGKQSGISVYAGIE